MNRIFAGLLLILNSFAGFSQIEQASKIMSYDKVEEPPFHKDCEALNDFACSLEKVSAYLNRNFNHELFGPEDPIINFMMKFIIDEHGKVAWVKPLSDSELVNEEITRLMKEMPSFVPGRDKGKEVSVIYLMPISLKYQYYFPDTYSLSKVDIPPLFKDCNKAEDMKRCFVKELSMMINKKYGFGSVPDGVSSAAITILINEEGQITEYLVRATSKEFKKGLEKIRKKLPVFESGAILNGEKVKVTINMPVTVKSTRYR